MTRDCGQSWPLLAGFVIAALVIMTFLPVLIRTNSDQVARPDRALQASGGWSAEVRLGPEDAADLQLRGRADRPEQP